MINHFYSANGRINLTYSALQKNDSSGSKRANNKIFMIMVLGMSFVEQCAKLRKLLVHCNYKSYFLHSMVVP